MLIVVNVCTPSTNVARVKLNVKLRLACLQIALNNGNGNSIQLKSPQSAVCILPLVCNLTFTPSPGVRFSGPRGFLLILSSFFIWKFATRSADRSAKTRQKRKPLVKIVENLTFMLAQHLTAVKDFIFF